MGKKGGKWHNIETVRQGRWWFFWNLVIRGKTLSVQCWTKGDDDAKIRLDIDDIIGGIKEC